MRNDLLFPGSRHKSELCLLFFRHLQLAITIGILIAQLINYGAQYIHPWGWQLALGLAAIPAFTLSIGAYLLPETPNSLIERSHMTEGRRVLERIRGTEGEQEMASGGREGP
jgi:hypothetical protein